MKRRLLLFCSFSVLLLSNLTITAQHFQTVYYPENPYNSMQFVIYTATLDGVGLVAGDEIAVFDIETSSGDEICVGTFVLISGTGPFVFPAGADDPLTTDVQEGFNDGNSIIFRMWDSSLSKEITLISPIFNLAPPLIDVFTESGTAGVDLSGYSLNTWDGSTDNDWHTADNWNSGIVTDASDDVVIPTGLANYPTITSVSECNDLLIESDATGNGSILGNDNLTVNGTTTVERYFLGYNDGANNGWHNISSPVDNMAISGSGFDFVDPSDDDLYRWNEALDLWENYKGTGFTNFENGRGYLCALHSTSTLSFTGSTLNEDDVTHSNLTNTVGGFHLLGNPFASALEWNNGDWARSNVSGIAQIWEESGNNYTLLNANAIIPSTNGFFVEVSSATNTITIPTSARVHDATNNYKGSENTIQDALVLEISNNDNNYKDLNRIGFKAGATEAWDIEYDAHKLFGGSDAPQLWTVFEDELFSQNFVPFVLEPYQVNLNFSAGTNSTHTINASGINSFTDGVDIYLEDLFTEDLIHLNQQTAYTFDASTTDESNRFALHFYGVTGIGEDLEASANTQIYAYNKKVYVKFNEIPAESSEIEIYNTMGQLVYNSIISPSQVSSINLEEKTGIYVVLLKTENGIVTNKVMIK